MIDPIRITDYNRSDEQLEELALFCVAVAFRNALFVAKALDTILEEIPDKGTPFEKVRKYAKKHDLAALLVKHGIGLQTKKAGYLTGLVNSGINLRTCTAQDLEAIKGIGPKTARFFILHTRPKARVACLDTHILSFLRNYVNSSFPKSTPSGKKYITLESIFLHIVDKSLMTTAELDLFIWNHYSGNYPITEETINFFRSIARVDP